MSTILETILGIIRSPLFMVFVTLLIAFYTTWRFARKSQSDIYSEFDKLLLFLLIWVFVTRLLYLIVFYDQNMAWNILPFRVVQDFDNNTVNRVFFDTYPWSIFKVWDFNYFISASLVPVVLFSMIDSKFKLGKTYFLTFVRFGRISLLLMSVVLLVYISKNPLTGLDGYTYPLILGFLVCLYFVTMSQRFSNATFLKWVLFLSYLVFALNSLFISFDIKKLLVYLGIFFLTIFLFLLEKAITIKENSLDRSRSDIDIVKERARYVRRGAGGAKSFNQSYREVNESTISSIFGSGVKGSLNKIFGSKNENTDK
jgi:hypothetical protein